MPDLIDLSKMQTRRRRGPYGFDRIDRFWQSPNSETWDAMWQTVSVESYWASALTGKLPPQYVSLIVNELPPGARILEAGCGLGHVVLAMRARGLDCYGLDFASETIQRLRENFPRVPFVDGDIRHLPFSDAYFDGYVSLGVIEHFEEEQHVMLQEAARVVRPGGYIFVSVPALNLWRRRKYLSPPENVIPSPIMPFFESCISLEEMSFLLARAGFDVVRHAYMNTVMGFAQETAIRPLYRLIEDVRYVRGAVDRILHAILPGEWFGHMLMVVGRRSS